MSRYNDYAVKLDEAFKKARNEYAKLVEAHSDAERRYNAAHTWFSETYEGERAIKQAKAKIALSEASNALRTEGDKIWDEFYERRNSIKSELAAKIAADGIANPDGIDANALELLKSGILGSADMAAMVERHDKNPTMLRLIAKYAAEKAESAEGAERGQFLNIANAYKNGSSRVMQAWEALETISNYCSGRRHSSQGRADATYTAAMGSNWESLTAEHIKDF